MADGQIISRADIRARARAAFYSNKPRTSHNMNPHAAALFDWLEEYDRCANQRTHFAIMESQRFDAAQVSI